MKMKLIALSLIALTILSATSSIAFAMPKKLSGSQLGKANGQAGKSQTVHLYLVEKNPADWTIVQDGAWGKLKFSTKNNKFVFNGHGLTSDTSYSLIYYPDPWPGTGCKLLGTGVANKGGNVNIKGTFDFGSIPIIGDTNKGAKIWLVLDADETCDGTTAQMTGWNPTEYLFEYDLIEKPV